MWKQHCWRCTPGMLQKHSVVPQGRTSTQSSEFKPQCVLFTHQRFLVAKPPRATMLEVGFARSTGDAGGTSLYATGLPVSNET